MKPVYNTELRNRRYRQRIQTALICTLLFFIAVFRYWPAAGPEDDLQVSRFSEDPLSGPELVFASRQVAVEHVPPVVPRAQTTRPEDEIVDVEIDLELEGFWNGAEWGPMARDPGRGPLVGQPDRPPRVRRIVEPVMPARARRDGVRLEIEIRFIVGADGEVEEVAIAAMRMFRAETGNYESVEETGYGFREITLRAASQWLFHPAQHEGDFVRSSALHSFTFGP